MIVMACLRGKHLAEDLPKRPPGSTGVQKSDFFCLLRDPQCHKDNRITET
jgi:hypothetical protein